MSSTVRMRSAIEKPFSQRRRSTGQMQKGFQPDPQTDYKDSGETSGDNLRTIHENCYGSQVLANRMGRCHLEWLHYRMIKYIIRNAH